MGGHHGYGGRVRKRAPVVRSLLYAAVMASLVSGCATPHYTALSRGYYALQAASAGASSVEIVGEGRYAYQFIITNPKDGSIWPNHPYALTTLNAFGARSVNLPFVADAKDVYQGVSDSQGRTAIFKLRYRLRDSRWDVRERIGKGDHGETFRLVGHDGKALGGFPYMLVLCSSPPIYHRGYSYPNGDTAYSASDGPVMAHLYVLDDDGEAEPEPCAAGRGEVKPEPPAPPPPKR